MRTLDELRKEEKEAQKEIDSFGHFSWTGNLEIKKLKDTNS